MIIVSLGMSRIATAPSPPLGDGRTAKYSLEKCSGVGIVVEMDEEKEAAGESEKKERFEEKEDVGE